MKLRTLALASCVGALLTGCGQHAPAPASAPSPPVATAPVAAKLPPPPPQAMPTEGSTRSLAPDHSTIRYRVYGQGEPTLVFIHCWSCDSGFWDQQLNELAQKYTLVTLDLAGHGRSDARKRKRWTMASYGADVAAVVAATGKRRVILVGHSMGGAVALEAARQLPGQVIGIVGVDTLRDLVTPDPKEATEPLLAAMRKDFAKATADYAEQNLFTEHTDPIIRRWIVKKLSSARPSIGIPSLENLVNMNYRPLLEELDVPIVAINAERPPTDEAGIRRVEPRFRVVTIGGVGHFLMLEKPSEFNRMLGHIADRWQALEPRTTQPLSEPAPAR